MTVVEVTGFGGMWNTLVPAPPVLAGQDLVPGGVAVFFLNRAASSEVA